MSADTRKADWGSGASLMAAADLVTPMAIRVAATLRIADRIHGGDRDLPALAEATETDPYALELLLGHLVETGVLTRDESGFGLTALGEHLRDDHPEGLRSWLDLDGPARSVLCMTELLYTVRTGEPAYPRRFGRSFYQDCAADRAFAEGFNALMSSRLRLRDVAAGIASGYDWGSLGSVADVGGGDGTLLIELLRAHPSLRGTVLDLRTAVEAAERNIRSAGFDDRAGAAEADFLRRIPAGFGGYLLSNVLPDWPDEDAVTILRTCAEAAASHGKVLVIAPSSANKGAAHQSAGQNLRLLALSRGRHRSLDELESLAARSGMKLHDLTDTGAHLIIEFAPVPGAA